MLICLFTGFLGGINWAILVAWVCKNHPRASTSNLLEIFFRVFASWKWANPVLLQPIQQTPPKGVVELPAWNPDVNPRDGLHIMPIITPAYPSMNSSYNVGFPQLRSIQNEMILACNHLRKHKNDFAALFKPSDFFSRHEHFLQVTIRAANRQDFVEWFRLVESRLRVLITDLETEQVHAWPFARFFDRRYDSDGNCLGHGKTKDENAMHESLFFIALRFADEVETIDMRFAPSAFLHNVNSWNNRVAGMDLSLKHITNSELPTFVHPKCDSTPKPNSNDSKEDNAIAIGSKENCENSNKDSAEAPSSPDLASPSKKCRITD
jgi:poly(A) polymerase